MTSHAENMLKSCRLCPRQCGVDRTAGQKGFCRSGDRVKLARASLHLWEEPCISGTRGSGTVFFSNCNMMCVFCQNHDISQGSLGVESGPAAFARALNRLILRNPHNLNLVSPSHYLPQIAAGLQNLDRRPPVMWNSNGYESVEAIETLDGLVDVYLPDLKYCDDGLAVRYSSAPGYFKAATQAILEMHRQVGAPVFDAEGIVRRGLIVRHLILPGHAGDSCRVLRWVADSLPRDVYVSLMSQYVPVHRAREFSGIDRRLTEREYDRVLDCFTALGLENGYCQDVSSASPDFTPPFDLEGLD